MSERLRKLVNDELSRLGENSVAKLAVKSGVSDSLIRHVKSEKCSHLPKRTTVIKLALACGLTEDDARALASKCARAKKAS